MKSGVSRACRYDPEMNPTYRELAAHYGIAVTATRVKKPRDKAKVEAGVLVVERWILARLRKRRWPTAGRSARKRSAGDRDRRALRRSRESRR